MPTACNIRITAACNIHITASSFSSRCISVGPLFLPRPACVTSSFDGTTCGNDCGAAA